MLHLRFVKEMVPLHLFLASTFSLTGQFYNHLHKVLEQGLNWNCFSSCSKLHQSKDTITPGCFLVQCRFPPFRKVQWFVSDLAYRHWKVGENLYGTVDLKQLKELELQPQSIYAYLSVGTITTVQVMLTLKLVVQDSHK